MINILPIKHITPEDGLIFGKLNVLLADLARMDFPVADGLVLTAPEFHLRSILEHYDFNQKEIFEQSLTLVKKELEKLDLPEELIKGLGKHKSFLVSGESLTGVKNLWAHLLNNWIGEIKGRLWMNGFQQGLTEDLKPQIVVFTNKIESLGRAFYEKTLDEVIIQISEGKLEPKDLKKLDELVQAADKKLLIKHSYEWILDSGIKLIGIKPYTPGNYVIASDSEAISSTKQIATSPLAPRNDNKSRSAVKVYFDLSTGLVVERGLDGVYIRSEEIFDLNKPRDSFEELIFRLVEAANTFPDQPVLFKLADKSEGMGKVRGTLRLLHQQNLLDPLLDAADFVRHKKGLTNVHLVIPFVRSIQEFLQIKRELSTKNLSRKSSLEIWLELSVPENIVNLEDYLEAGLDGVILNMDELIAYLNGFDHMQEDLVFYKNEVNGLIKFLEDGLKLLHKAHIPFIAVGSLTFYPAVLEFLVEKGVYGVVAQRYESGSAKDLLHNAEKRLILRKST